MTREKTVYTSVLYRINPGKKKKSLERLCYRAKLNVLFLSDLGRRLLFLGALPSLCKSAMSLTLIMLLSLRLMGLAVVVPEGGWVDWEEEDMFTLLVFNPDKMSLMSLGPFISGLPPEGIGLGGSREDL